MSSRTMRCQVASKQPQTHCIHGHEYTPENTGYRPDFGWRYCKVCQRRKDEAKRRLLGRPIRGRRKP